MFGLNPRQLRTLSKSLLVLDILGCVVIFNFANHVRTGEWLGVQELTMWLMIAVVTGSLYVFDAFRVSPQTTSMTIVTGTVLASSCAGVILASSIYLMGPTGLDPIYWRSVLTFSMLFILLWVTAHRLVFGIWVRREASKSKWLCLGGGETAHRILNDYAKKPNMGRMYVYSGVSNPHLLDEAGTRVERISDLNALLSSSWAGVILANDTPLSAEETESLMQARLRGTQIFKVDTFYEQTWAKVPLFHLQDDWFTAASGFVLLHENVQLRIKRLLDLLIGSVLLVLLLPVALISAVAIKLDSTGPILYTQKRVGHQGRLFRLYKFRTMFNDAEKDGVRWAGEEDDRVTRVGRWLRLTRLDEYPQLFNVIRGTMSFVGPRPERPEFTTKLEKEIPYYDLRHLVKPGITGWAQVMRPYGSSVEDALEKLEYDLYYIKNYSLILDGLIILKTVRVVLFGQGR